MVRGSPRLIRQHHNAILVRGALRDLIPWTHANMANDGLTRAYGETTPSELDRCKPSVNGEVPIAYRNPVLGQVNRARHTRDADPGAALDFGTLVKAPWTTGIQVRHVDRAPAVAALGTAPEAFGTREGERRPVRTRVCAVRGHREGQHKKQRHKCRCRRVVQKFLQLPQRHRSRADQEG
jgi:hypothetical protein